MAQVFYRLWYETDVKENLSNKCKINIAKRISDLTLREPIWMNREKDYSNFFPELKKFAHISISGLQLVTIMECIVGEFRK